MGILILHKLIEETPFVKTEGVFCWIRIYLSMKKLLCLQVSICLWVVGFSQTENALKYKAVLIPESINIISGQPYKAKVMIVASDSSEDIKGDVTIKSDLGNYIYDMDSGVSSVQVVTSGNGEQVVSGEVNCKINGQKHVLPFSGSYLVISGAGTISPEKMNMLYTGIENLVFISIPGFSPERVVATVKNGEIVRKSDYLYLVKVFERGDVIINMSVKMPDSSVRAMGSAKFRVRKIPTPVSQLGTLLNGNAESVEIIKKSANQVYASQGEGFPIEGLKYTVNKFTLTIAHKDNKGMESVEVIGEKLNDKATELINNIKSGDKIIIDTISVTGPDGERTASPFIVTAR